MALLGLIGGPLVIASMVAVLFGVFKAGSAWQAIATIPEIFWELSLGIYLIVKGFKPSPLTSVDDPLREPSTASAGAAHPSRSFPAQAPSAPRP